MFDRERTPPLAPCTLLAPLAEAGACEPPPAWPGTAARDFRRSQLCFLSRSRIALGIRRRRRRSQRKNASARSSSVRRRAISDARSSESGSFDVDVDLPDTAACGHDRAIDCRRARRKRAESPGAVSSEEPEVTGCRCRDFGGELPIRVEEPHVCPRDRITAAQHAALNHGFFGHVDTGQTEAAFGCC